MPFTFASSAFGRMQRTVAVSRTAVRVYRSYKRTQKRVVGLPAPERDAAWRRRHQQSAAEIAATAKRLRGLYIKSAQFLGARADLLPEAYITELSQLHDRVPPLPYEAIRPVLRQGLGAEPEQVFAEFERTPVAAASLAQVHRARLRDGRRVAVKVQYPDIARLVQLDLRNLTMILRLVHRVEKNLDLEPLARAVGKLVPQELDFVNEGRNTEAIAAALAHRGDVVAPGIVWEHTSARVLVTEYIDGIKISDVEALRAQGLDPVAAAERAVDVWGEMVLRTGHFHGDPHPGNILVLDGGRLALLDFGLTARLDPEARDGFAQLSRAAAQRDPVALMAAFKGLGYVAANDSPMAYMGLGRNMTGMGRDGDVQSVNIRLAQALRGFNIAGVPAEALLVMRVLGLLAGLSARLGRTGPVLSAWSVHSEDLAATGT
jgi:predicted unusual protein kinase regulating ubiquinone biosynthesis (AarF/ABC1/UbiB family)